MNNNVVIIIIIFMILLIICSINITKCNYESTKYEFALNGEIFESKNCYLKENGLAYCEYENENLRVDNYYEVN